MACCEMPGKPHLQVPYPGLHLSGLSAREGKRPCAFVSHLPQRGPGVGWYLRVKRKASRGYSAEEFCPAIPSSITSEGLLCCHAMLSLIFCTYLVQVHLHYFLQAFDFIIIQQ